MEKKKKNQPSSQPFTFVVSGMTEKEGRFSYKVEALSYSLAYIKAIKRLRKENPKSLIKFIGRVHIEKKKEEKQLVLSL